MAVNNDEDAPRHCLLIDIIDMGKALEVLRGWGWWLGVFGVLLGGMVLLGWPDGQVRTVYPLGEMQRDAGVVARMHEGEWPQLGPSASVGATHFGPAYYYILYGLSWATGFDVLGLVLGNWLWLFLSGVLICALVWEVWRNRVAVVGSAVVFALSTLTFQLTRYVSNPNFVVAFAALFFWCVHHVYRTSGKQWVWWIGAVAGFAVAGQLHFAALCALGLCLLGASIRFRPRLWVLLSMAIVFLVLWLPFLQYEYAHNFLNVRGLLTVGGSFSFRFGDWVVLLAQFVGFLASPFVAAHVFFDVTYILGMRFVLLLMLAVFGGMLLVWIERRRKALVSAACDCGTAVFLRDMWVWGSVVFLLPFAFSAGTRIYYYFALIPLQYALIGGLVACLVTRRLWWVVAYSTSVLLILSLLQRAVYRASL